MDDFGSLDKIKGAVWKIKLKSCKIISYATTEVDIGTESKDSIAQIMVLIDSEQALAVPEGNEPVSKNRELNFKNVKEYIIAEKWISDPLDSWKITAKIQA